VYLCKFIDCIYHHCVNFRSCEADLKNVQERLQQTQETRMRMLANQDMLKFVICVHTVSCTVSIEDPYDFRQWFKCLDE